MRRRARAPCAPADTGGRGEAWSRQPRKRLGGRPPPAGPTQQPPVCSMATSMRSSSSNP
eukprot:CAMPEP_0170410718 /NCGR_PEP_ID=MMETSP0117_2-20130122/30039_1 /TAXON_ID=400756 /ORGANISM="Durinskia baltica, Strain CSIRO CS-38" /LENGTH=58 /DNA_ID=CAMNT_0010668269 /DNA_START=1 /DNA_END=173 /DNA_ORIENTATION=+